VSEILQRNLRALQEVDPALVERLCLPVDSAHVRLQPGQPPAYRIHRYFYPFVMGADAVERSLQPVGDDEDALLVGIGLGEQLDPLLDRGGDRTVTAWDRDPWLMRLTLARSDLTAAIRSGRLRLKLGPDLVHVVAEEQSAAVVPHDFLGAVYRFEEELLQHGLPGRMVLLRAGTLFVDDLARELAAEGYGVYTLDTERLAVEELELAVSRLDPAFIAAINYTSGLAEFCHAMGRPLMCWEIDPTTSQLRPAGTPTADSWIFTYRAGHVEPYRAAGFANVEHLPLATDTARRCPVELMPEEEQIYAAPVSFVGASMVAEALQFRQRFLAEYVGWLGDGGASDPGGGVRMLDEVLAAQRADLTRYLVPELLDARFGDFLEYARAAEGAEDPVMWVAEIAASEKRLSVVASLGRLGAVAWGDAGWQQVERFGARYSGRYARHTDELNRVYCASTINVDIGRLYQPDIVTMRVFDVLACGGFLLAERSADLERLFEIGVEVEAWSSLEELVSKASFYLNNPEAARAVAERGMNAVRTRHTIRQRVQQMLTAMGARRGNP
jgi:hypothetical protein